MATRLKTVHYSFVTLASLTNNTLTNFTQQTLYLPETGTKTFKSAILNITFDDIITATGGSITTETVNLRLGAAAYTSISNANILTNSGENLSGIINQDFTSHFVSNWTGSSMTCDLQIQMNQSTGTTTGFVNVCATLEITYEYDDTSTIQIKTVFIPLNAPVSAIATAATTYDTIPILDTYLPESTKTYRNIHLVIQGNEGRNGATTDHTMTLRIGSASVTTGNYEGALASDRFYRYIWDVTSAYPSKAATQTFQPTATVARCHHFQAYLVVTYEYREDLSTTILNSLMLPMEVDSPFGGTTNQDYQRATRDLWIQEPGTITTNRVAFFAFWTQATATSPLYLRIGTGSFVTYTDVASVLCGNDACMVRNDTAFTLVRGKNVLNFDAYTTDTSDFGWNICGFWLINYTSSKSPQGSGAHNHTVFTNITQQGTAAAAIKVVSAATSLQIPEPDYFITAIGTRTYLMYQNTAGTSGIVVNVERLVAENGIQWETAYCDLQQSDPEAGIFSIFSQVRDIFKRFPGDNYSIFNRMDIETNRRWSIQAPPGAAGTIAPGWFGTTLLTTYHSLSYTVNGTLSGNFSGTVTLELIRESTGEKLKETTRSGNGSFSFTWYDNTVPVRVLAKDAANDACSLSAVAGNTFDISTVSTGTGPKYFAY